MRIIVFIGLDVYAYECECVCALIAHGDALSANANTKHI